MLVGNFSHCFFPFYQKNAFQLVKGEMRGKPRRLSRSRDFRFKSSLFRYLLKKTAHE